MHPHTDPHTGICVSSHILHADNRYICVRIPLVLHTSATYACTRKLTRILAYVCPHTYSTPTTARIPLLLHTSATYACTRAYWHICYMYMLYAHTDSTPTTVPTYICMHPHTDPQTGICVICICYMLTQTPRRQQPPHAEALFYSVYLLYWYNSTNTDAAHAQPAPGGSVHGSITLC